ncbi:MAG: response regulator [Marinilabiliaceae bacterium]|nr:response regulator [Marinilabiliaceae bacterium]
MNKFFLITLLFFYILKFQAQEFSRVTHYSVDNGLSENHVLCMLQDRKGIMWFGTYGGLNRFDGYLFRNYKGDDSTTLSNCRIDRLKEDNRGFLWLQTNDNNIYRFNPSSETFLQIPQWLNQFHDYKGGINRILTLKDGSIWLYNSEKSKGCFRVLYNKINNNIKVTHFKTDKYNNSIGKIFLIQNGFDNYTWILSQNGIYKSKNGKKELLPIYNTFEANSYFSMISFNNETYFGGENGAFLVYNNNSELLKELSNDDIKGDIIEIIKLSDNTMLLSTDQSIFYLFDRKNNSTIAYNLKEYGISKIYGCVSDNNCNVWFDTDFNGAIYFNTKKKEINHLTINEKWYSELVPQKFYVIESKQNDLWIQIRNGGFYYFNKNKNRLELLRGKHSDEKNLSNVIHTSLVDQQGNLWLSTYFQGVDKVVFNTNHFRFTQPIEKSASKLQNEVRTVFKDSQNQLWVCTKEGKVLIYDNTGNPKGYLGKNGVINENEILNIGVYNIIEDSKSRIWLATKGDGIYILTPQSDHSFKITNYTKNEADLYCLNCNAVYSLFEDFKGRIWVGTFGGGVNIVDQSDGTVRFINKSNLLKKYPLDECPKIRSITGDSDGNILIGTTNGLLISKLPSGKYEKYSFNRYAHNSKLNNSLEANDIQCIFSSQKGDVFIGLSAGGINKIIGGIGNNKKIKFEKIKKNRMPLDIVYSINEDSIGNLWLSSQTRIIKINYKTEKIDYIKPQPYDIYFFSEGAAFQTNQGELFYGTSNGFISFFPDDIKQSNFSPPIYFDQLQVYFNPDEKEKKQSFESILIDDLKQISLKHYQNIISISYASLDYSNPDAIQYACYLEGIDTDWNYVGKQRVARYFNLPKGEFTFHVKSTNSDGEWCDNVRSIKIVKKPSFWESPWGFGFYIITFLLLTGIVSYVILIIYKLRNEIAFEQKISEMKLRFFTDISHELRTPLTLIISPISNILKREHLTDTVKEQLQIVQENTNRLLRMINQLLDFRKIQNEKMKLQVEPVIIKNLITEICHSFKNIADDKGIKILLFDSSFNSKIWIDKDKVEKVFFNLISNALKYSRHNDTVTIELIEQTNKLIIEIKDQGQGIAKDKIKLLFNRFESFASVTSPFSPSTGIGLALTKELIDLHKAEISVESERGMGTVFKISFLKGYNHYGQDVEFILNDFNSNPTTNETELNNCDKKINVNIDNNKTNTNEKIKVLIVEDNDELRNFLKSSLDYTYEVAIAANGIDAVYSATAFSPDIIISDLLMPDMNGIKLCEILKQDICTSHIPFILLTAKTDIESKIEAMQQGVDDYITKPFNLTYLEARIENIMKIRYQLQDYFKTSLTSGVITLSKPKINSVDEVFLQKIVSFLESNYDNSDINIDIIADETGVSRSSFFKKLKSLTGMAPVEFVREFRLQKSLQFIDAGETNVSQIAYRVGINDQRYFSKCFKLLFGMTPSEYINKKYPKH